MKSHNYCPTVRPSSRPTSLSDRPTVRPSDLLPALALLAFAACSPGDTLEMGTVEFSGPHGSAPAAREGTKSGLREPALVPAFSDH